MPMPLGAGFAKIFASYAIRREPQAKVAEEFAVAGLE